MDNFIVFIANILNVDAKSIDSSTSYQSISEWDSLMHIRIVAEIESYYNVEIPIDEVTSIQTIGDFYDYIVRGK